MPNSCKAGIIACGEIVPARCAPRPAGIRRCERRIKNAQDGHVTRSHELVRLQKYLAQAGLASRRGAEDLIRQGRVKVNDQVVTQMGVKVDPAKDKISVDEAVINLPKKPHTYLMLNKPRYVLSSTRDEQGKRKTVLDLVKSDARLFPVGRLDYQSEGLILLTTDGDLAQKLTHPSYQHEREYHVLVKGDPAPQTLRRWRAGGFVVDGKPVGPMQVERLTNAGPGWLRVVLREGRKRQIRTVAEALGHPVVNLIRVRFGPLKLGKLKPGAWRPLTPREVDMLRRSTGGKKPPPSARSQRSQRRSPHSRKARG